VIWIQGLTAVLLVQNREGIAVMPAVTVVLLHPNGIDTGPVYSVVSTGWRGNFAYACIYCNSVTSHFYGYRELL